jgi:high-affinity nickel-transport protein
MSAHLASPHAPSLARRARTVLTPAEWRRVGWLAAAILALHALGSGLLLAGTLPIGLGVTAYLLGVRHAFDADHIAAIDNATRKLMADGRRPLSVGFCFSLGHTTVVFALVALVAAGVRGVGGAVAADDSWLHQATGVIGPLVSGSFLLLIALANLALLLSTVRAARRMRQDGEAAQVELRPAGGVLTRVFGRAMRAVTRSWHMYPLGVLFGLGFDTATEVALLVLAGGAVLGPMPFYAVLCLPLLFAAGMTLFDTLDGVAMRGAYGRALARPGRRVAYDLAVTGLSVVTALTIGALELTSVLGAPLGIDLNGAGFGIVVAFLAAWALSALASAARASRRTRATPRARPRTL